MNVRRLIASSLLAGSLSLVGSLSAQAAGISPAITGSGVCTGGTIPSGTYARLTITGSCALSSGTTTVLGNVIVGPNAFLEAAFAEPQVVVLGSVLVQRGGGLVLGCSPALGCPDTTSDVIRGSLRAIQPLGVILHSDTIYGGTVVLGGGGGVNCDSSANFGGGPAYTDFEDNTLYHGLTVSSMRSCYLGIFRNNVNGSVAVNNNIMADPDANEVATNTISGNLACFGNTPAPQVGDSGGFPNMVSGNKLGQCAGL